MRRPVRLSISLLLLLALLPAGTAAAAASGPETRDPLVSLTPPTEYVPGAVIVVWKGNADHTTKVEAREEAEVEYEADLGQRRFQLVSVEPGQSAGQAVAALNADPAVAVAERDSLQAPSAVPDDPLFNQEWGLENTGAGIGGFGGAVAGDDIDALGAWSRTVGTPSTVVADIDTGYRFEHPDLAGVAWTNPGEIAGNGIDDDGNGYVDDVHGWDFVGANAEAPGEDADPTDDNLVSGGHGVHTAGTIGAAGDNGIGITGVAQDVRIMPLRVCSNWPSTSEARCPTSSIIAAINYAGANDARVANLSLGGTTNSPAELNAFAGNPHTLYVIAAGNDGQNNDSVKHYPCDYEPASTSISGAVDNIVCVAATNQADQLASFSDWGANSVDLGAPGTEILSTYPARAPIADTFEAEDFATKWTATGPDGGFSRTSESPLTSHGITDTPGGPPVADTTRESSSAAVTIPAGLGPCELRQTRTVRATADTGDAYSYDVLLNGGVVASASPTSSGRFRLPLEGALSGGGSLQLRFRFVAGSAPASSDGVWLDNLELTCTEGVGDASGYAFLQGTSMAAPHVTGAAALMFSLRPSASVGQVRRDLLASVDPAASLTGKTVTGGRLDASRALDLLETPPAAPALSGTQPAPPAPGTSPRVIGSAPVETTVRIYAGAACEGSPLGSGTAAELASPGIPVAAPPDTTEQLTADASDSAGNVSSCSAPLPYPGGSSEGQGEEPPAEEEGEGGEPPSEHESTPPGGTPLEGTAIVPRQDGPAPPAAPAVTCTVPRLAGKTLAKARSALSAAGCRTGAVRRPKAKPGRLAGPLVVVSSSPAPGANVPAGTAVALKLGPKPSRHHH